jgi:hypothetical protein
MNYQRIHDTIINNASSQYRKKYQGIYYEKHHIIPKCMGGNDSSENLVLLTAKEHYIVHILLCEIYPSNHKLMHAAWLMCNGYSSITQDRKVYISGKIYEHIKSKNSLYMSLKFKGRIGKSPSNETRMKLSLANKGKVLSLETLLKRKLTRISKMYNHRHSAETKLKMSISRQNKSTPGNCLNKIKIHNPITKHCCYIPKDAVVPEGYIHGQIYKHVWCNDGIINKRYAINEIPENFKRGLIRNKVWVNDGIKNYKMETSELYKYKDLPRGMIKNFKCTKYD